MAEQCWPCAAGRHCGQCAGCCAPAGSPANGGTGGSGSQKSGCFLWTMISLAFWLVVVVLLLALSEAI